MGVAVRKGPCRCRSRGLSGMMELILEEHSCQSENKDTGRVE